jgi:hypothetical protein
MPDPTERGDVGSVATMEQLGPDAAAMAAPAVPGHPGTAEGPSRGFRMARINTILNALSAAELGKLALRHHGRALWRAARPTDRHSAQRSD